MDRLQPNNMASYPPIPDTFYPPPPRQVQHQGSSCLPPAHLNNHSQDMASHRSPPGGHLQSGGYAYATNQLNAQHQTFNWGHPQLQPPQRSSQQFHPLDSQVLHRRGFGDLDPVLFEDNHNGTQPEEARQSGPVVDHSLPATGRNTLRRPFDHIDPNLQQASHSKAPGVSQHRDQWNANGNRQPQQLAQQPMASQVAASQSQPPVVIKKLRKGKKATTNAAQPAQGQKLKSKPQGLVKQQYKLKNKPKPRISGNGIAGGATTIQLTHPDVVDEWQRDGYLVEQIESLIRYYLELSRARGLVVVDEILQNRNNPPANEYDHRLFFSNNGGIPTDDYDLSQGPPEDTSLSQPQPQYVKNDSKFQLVYWPREYEFVPPTTTMNEICWNLPNHIAHEDYDAFLQHNVPPSAIWDGLSPHAQQMILASGSAIKDGINKYTRRRQKRLDAILNMYGTDVVVNFLTSPYKLRPAGTLKTRPHDMEKLTEEIYAPDTMRQVTVEDLKKAQAEAHKVTRRKSGSQSTRRQSVQGPSAPAPAAPTPLMNVFPNAAQPQQPIVGNTIEVSVAPTKENPRGRLGNSVFWLTDESSEQFVADVEVHNNHIMVLAKMICLTSTSVFLLGVDEEFSLESLKQLIYNTSANLTAGQDVIDFYFSSGAVDRAKIFKKFQEMIVDTIQRQKILGFGTADEAQTFQRVIGNKILRSLREISELLAYSLFRMITYVPGSIEGCPVPDELIEHAKSSTKTWLRVREDPERMKRFVVFETPLQNLIACAAQQPSKPLLGNQLAFLSASMRNAKDLRATFKQSLQSLPADVAKFGTEAFDEVVAAFAGRLRQLRRDTAKSQPTFSPGVKRGRAAVEVIDLDDVSQPSPASKRVRMDRAEKSPSSLGLPPNRSEMSPSRFVNPEGTVALGSADGLANSNAAWDYFQQLHAEGGMEDAPKFLGGEDPLPHIDFNLDSILEQTAPVVEDAENQTDQQEFVLPSIESDSGDQTQDQKQASIYDATKSNPVPATSRGGNSGSSQKRPQSISENSSGRTRRKRSLSTDTTESTGNDSSSEYEEGSVLPSRQTRNKRRRSDDSDSDFEGRDAPIEKRQRTLRARTQSTRNAAPRAPLPARHGQAPRQAPQQAPRYSVGGKATFDGSLSYGAYGGQLLLPRQARQSLTSAGYLSSFDNSFQHQYLFDAAFSIPDPPSAGSSTVNPLSDTNDWGFSPPSPGAGHSPSQKNGDKRGRENDDEANSDFEDAESQTRSFKRTRLSPQSRVSRQSSVIDEDIQPHVESPPQSELQHVDQPTSSDAQEASFVFDDASLQSGTVTQQQNFDQSAVSIAQPPCTIINGESPQPETLPQRPNSFMELLNFDGNLEDLLGDLYPA